MLAVWAEMDAVLADQFRDGNVPAQMAPLTVAKAAFAALPKTVTTYYYRGDAACHEKELLRCCATRNVKKAARMHWFCDQRADERGVARGHSEFRKGMKAYGEPEPGIDRSAPK